MAEWHGFWSYVHADDEVDQGRVVQLARDIVSNYEAIRAEDLRLFLDRDDIPWGERWRDVIDDSLSSVAFVIPVLTPRFFQSVECRREVQFFIDQTRKLGISQLVLPLLYVDVPEMGDVDSTDPLIVDLKATQWKKWTHLRFKARDSEDYRTAVFELATEISARVGEAERTDVAAIVAANNSSGEDNEPGLVDRIAALEEALPRWNETITQIGANVTEIGDILRRSTGDISKANSQGKAFAARLAIARRVAEELEPPVDQIESLSRIWVSDANAIDLGVRILIERLAEETAEGGDPDTARGFARSVRDLSAAVTQGLSSTSTMADVLENLASLSRDMRPVLRRLRTSLVSMAEVQEVTDGWLDRVEKSGLASE